MLSNILPAPKHKYQTFVAEDEEKGSAVDESQSSSVNSSVHRAKIIPSYPNRAGYLPIDVEDFGDGGAFPEIHVVQYPLNMGRPGQKSSTALVPVQVDESGKIRTDQIVKLGSNQHKIVQSQMSDIKEKAAEEDKLALPEDNEIQSTAERTKLALEALIQSKISAAKPSTSASKSDVAESTFIRYTPNPDAPGYNPEAKQRVIKMVEAQIDPLEPPKHKHTKAPRGPPSPPVPVLHSPPRKLTVADQQAWKIPPCVSNWKNARGFIIPLDKRLAADGRGLQEATINNKFATVSEALFIAERKATEDLKYRNEIRKKMALKEKEEREEALREMANRARMERAGIKSDDAQPEEDDESKLQHRLDRFSGAAGAVDGADSEETGSDIEEFQEETEEERIARQQRERLRIERRKDREREIRLENMKGALRKSKVDRDEGRDISEKIALGMLKGTGGKLTGESLYDNRLFNQSSGMDAGFGAEDEYNTYSKPLFDRGEASSIYRPRQSAEDVYGDADVQLKELSSTSRFRPDKGFQGTEAVGQTRRDAPVQFEKSGASKYVRNDNEDEGEEEEDHHAQPRSRHRRSASPDQQRRGRERSDSRDRRTHGGRREDSRDRDRGRDRGRDERRDHHGSSRLRRDRDHEDEDVFNIKSIVQSDGDRKRPRRDE